VIVLGVCGGLLIVAGVAGASLGLSGALLDIGTWTSLVLAVLPAILVTLGGAGLLIAQNGARNAALAQAHPDAHLVVLASLPGSAAQMRELRAAFKLPTKFSLVDYNMTLVVDTRFVQFYRGGSRPRLILDIPANSLVSIGTNSRLTPAGTPAIERVILVFQTPAGPISQGFAFAPTGLRPRILHNQELTDELRLLSLAAGHTVPLQDFT
jgi:hypothetical protein